MSNFGKIPLTLINVLIIGVLGYSVINSNNCNVTEVKTVMAISLMFNLLLIEYMLVRISKKRG